jgi:hypothetical protein
MVRASRQVRRIGAGARALLGYGAACALLAAPAAWAQAVIKVNDDVNVKLGILLQPQADWTQDTASGGYVQNLFVRRIRVMMGGAVAKDVTFFFETDDPNLGKSAAGTKTTGGFIVQDAFMTWKLHDAFMVEGGLMLTGVGHNSLQSAATLLPIDYGVYTFLYSTPLQNSVGRDTGFQLRGYPLDKHLEYRVGLWQGLRDASGRNALRTTARLQYEFFDTETGFFYTGTTYGKKKILSIGAGYDQQERYQTIAADTFLDYPLGPGAVSAQLDYFRYDGSYTLKTLPKMDVFYGEAGYYIASARVMPYFTYGSKDVAGTDTGDEKKWTLGLSYVPFGHNFNVKAAFGRIEPGVGKSANTFTVQLQAWYF